MSDVLDLSALVPERPKARLRTPEDPEGTIYELAVPEEFGAVALSRLGHVYREHDALWENESRSKAQDKRLEALLNDLAGRLILDAPAAAVAALPALTKRMVAVRFFVAAGTSMQHLGADTASLLENS